MKIAIVVSDFNMDITRKMVKTAEKRIAHHNAEVGKILHVPGAFEIPLGIKRVLDSSDGIITLAAVIKGDTDHDKLCAETVTSEIMRLSLDTNKPISLGIIGPGATLEHARERAEEYAMRAVDAVMAMLEE